MNFDSFATLGYKPVGVSRWLLPVIHWANLACIVYAVWAGNWVGILNVVAAVTGYYVCGIRTWIPIK
jgi:hypothetical protein